LSLISVPIAIPITMDGNREEIVVQGLICSSVGAKWHIVIIPIVYALDCLSLMHVPMMMQLD
jgi:hypothetical protein